MDAKPYFWFIKVLNFSKATSIDSGFGAAWIGYAHSFAMEGEHDQAITAYNQASRVLPGSHLPKLYLGMVYAKLQQFSNAKKYLYIASEKCQTDPLVFNELGSVLYSQKEYNNI